ncbi:MAG: hypothetical protein K2P81_07320 [Bacteriovoracaceae bacterium]|nr:hypothetical protein [Bacteriovoracaceae bacterium]
MKTLILFSLLIFSAQVSADSCFPVYEAEAAKINKEDGYTQSVGGQIYVVNGQIGYWPGIQVAADIDNWAEDFVMGVKYGPFMKFGYDKEDPREDILKMFAKQIKDDCSLPKDNYDNVRAMLKELMNDGSFCPEGKMLERPFLNRWKHFKKVLKSSVEGGRFQEYCQSSAVADDSSREIKDVGSSSSSSSSKPAQASGK